MHKITKIAENNVEVKYTKEMIDITGNVFYVYDEDETESFGLKSVTRQLEDVDKQILNWQNFDEKAYKKSMQDRIQGRKDLLLEVKKEMEKI